MFVATMHLPDAHDPFTDPAWRWRRCGYLLRHGRQPVQALDDSATREAWLFRRALGRCRTDDNREQLAQDFPALAEAHRIYAGELLARWGLEARLLGGDPDDAIAARCGISVAGVEAYHATFYEVRPQLRADTYVVTALIGPKVHYGLTLTDPEQLLKLAGYGLGGLGVDRMLDYLVEPPTDPGSFDRLDLPALKKLRAKLQTKLLVLLLTTPASAVDPATWLQLGERFTAARREWKGGEGQQAVLASAQVLLDVLATLSKGEPVKDLAAAAVA